MVPSLMGFTDTGCSYLSAARCSCSGLCDSLVPSSRMLPWASLGESAMGVPTGGPTFISRVREGFLEGEILQLTPVSAAEMPVCVCTQE